MSRSAVGGATVPVVHVTHELAVSTGELIAAVAEELEWLRWVESAELCGRSRDVF